MPVDLIYRALDPSGSPIELRSAGDGAMPTMVGHFAVFNRWTEIDSIFEGIFLEKIAPGAFRKTFRERRDQIRALFQHGRDPVIGDKPLGPIEVMREDDIGAWFEVPLLDTSYNRDLVPGLEAGQYGSSFRFRVVAEKVNEEPKPSAENPKGLPERTITELKLYEFGPVTFPAYAGATAGLRSVTDRFLEEALAGLSPETLRSLAEAIETNTPRTPDERATTAEAAGASDEGAASQSEEPREHSELTSAMRRERLVQKYRRTA